METDYIIAGGGIAGCSLALELDMRGFDVMLFDFERPNSSSHVAAGIINPIVPKRVIPAWNANAFYPGIKTFYKKYENLLGVEIFKPMPMYQIHASEQERYLWQKQAGIKDNQMFVQSDVELPVASIDAKYGATLVNHCGKVAVSQFCNAIKGYFLSKNKFVSNAIDSNEIIVKSNRIEHRNISSKFIIFCEGERSTNNPYFKKIPITKTWGDILTIRCSTLHSQHVLLKQKHWIAALKDDCYLAGSNFIMENNSHKINEEINEMIQKLKEWLPEFELIESRRAARPTITDRRPVMGHHPEYKNIFIYNGLGTRGCSLISWLTPLYVDFLEGKSSLQKEMNINRFFKKV